MTLAKSCIVMQRYITSVVDGSCKKCKTINSRYSLVVTHPTTNLPAHGLSTAERTGSPVFHVLWSIAKEQGEICIINQIISAESQGESSGWLADWLADWPGNMKPSHAL